MKKVWNTQTAINVTKSKMKYMSNETDITIHVPA